MIILLCRNRVTDFSTWKTVFDSHGDAQRAAGLRPMHLWRALDDPNDVFFVFEVTSIEGARGFIDDPAAAEAGEESGVIEGYQSASSIGRSFWKNVQD